MEAAIDYFAVFGGVKIYAPTDEPLLELITTKILGKYKYLRNDIGEITRAENQAHSVLTALANGDRRTNSAFRKVDLPFREGIEIVDRLCDRGMLSLEKSRQGATSKPVDNDISERLLFTTPFARFWFSLVSPLFKGIKDGNYEEFLKEYENKKTQFAPLVFEQLSHEMVKLSFKDDPIAQIGRYWDDNTSLDIVGKTKSGKVIVGSCKYTNSKIKKTELSKLKKICEELGIKADIFVLFSKKGFTSELKSLKGDSLKLFTPRNFSLLVS